MNDLEKKVAANGKAITALTARVEKLEKHCARLEEAIRRAAPHMNLSEFLDDPDA